MARSFMLLLMFAVLSLSFVAGCDSSDDTDGDTTDGDTIDGDSIDGDSIDGDTIDGDSIDGDSIDGDTTDGDTIDGDSTDGDTIDGDSIDGDTTDGDTIDGDTIDGDSIDGDTTDGDTIDGDSIDGDTTDGDTIDGDSIDGDSIDGDTPDGDVDGDAADGDVDGEDENEADVVVAPGENCTNPIVIDAIPYNNASNAIVNFVNDIDFANNGESCTGYSNIGWDKVFSYTATSNINLTVSMTSYGWDGALYMLNTCVDGTQAQANCLYGSDSHGADVAEWIDFSATSGTTYYFVVDIAAAEYAPSDQGSFRMQLHENAGGK